MPRSESLSQHLSENSSKNLLRNLARQRLQALRQAKARLQSTERVSLIDFVHEVSPHLEPPSHLEPYATTLEGAVGGNLRICFAAPPQHGKTELCLRAFLWWDRYYPGKRHVYVTYNQDRSEQVAKDFLRLVKETGFLAEGSTLKQAHLVGGSSVIFTSIGGGLTGSAIDGVCIIDDPIKDGVDARSPTIRADTHNFWRSVARARRHPGTSFIEMATRWHSEDLTGYLIGEGWRYINLKAIADGAVDIQTGRVIGDPLNRRLGEALWPSYKSVEFFAEERADAYWWAAMYQGEPTPDGAQVFRDVRLCEEPPPLEKLRIAIGEDFAYSAKKHSDYSVAVVIGEDEDGICYVLDVVRVQVEPRQFRDRILELQERFGAGSTAFVARTEMGSVEFLRESGVVIAGLPATEDKLSRAIHVAAAWNNGRIRIPTGAPWREAFVREVCGFTGMKDRHDDQVDALAGAFHGLRFMPQEIEQGHGPYQRQAW